MRSTTNRTKTNYNNYIGIILILAIGLVLFMHYHYQRRKQQELRHEYINLQSKPIQSPYGWGYEILVNGKLYIHQEFIPAIAGKKGFASKDEALRVADRVMDKIRNKQIPPALNLQDLVELGVVKDTVAIKDTVLTK